MFVVLEFRHFNGLFTLCSASLSMAPYCGFHASPFGIFHNEPIRGRTRQRGNANDQKRQSPTIGRSHKAGYGLSETNAESHADPDIGADGVTLLRGIHVGQDGIDQRQGAAHADARQGAAHVELRVGRHPVRRQTGAFAREHRQSKQARPVVVRVRQAANDERRRRPEHPERQGDVTAQLGVALLVVETKVFGDRGQVGTHEILVAVQQDGADREQDDGPLALPPLEGAEFTAGRSRTAIGCGGGFR